MKANRTTPRRFYISVIFICTVFGLTGCGKEESADKEILRPVRTITVSSTAGGRERVFSGSAHAGVESRLSFKVGGTIKDLKVSVGDKIKKGDMIARLDSMDFDLQYQQAAASLAQAQAQLHNAELNFDRTRELYTNRSVSKSEFDTARTNKDTAKASFQSATKQVQLARQQQEYTKLKAPVDGSIATVDVEVNENVQVGQQVVLLSSGQEMKVRLAVPEVFIYKLHQGDPVTVKFDAFPDIAFKGSLQEIGVSAIEGGSTFPVTVDLDAPGEKIRAGMAAEVAIVIGKDKGLQILIPPVAVGEDHNGRFVYTVKSGTSGVGVIERRAVEVGELTTEGLEITKGLKEGDKVVTAGLNSLEAGRKVKLPITQPDK